MESAHFLKTGKLIKLSEQQFVDCSAAEGNEGCNGGLETYAFDYAKTNGLELESDYPYKGRDQDCKVRYHFKQIVEVTNYTHVPEKSVTQLKAAIDQQPTCVSIDANNEYIAFYESGIINTQKCGTDLDHAVTAVGYGVDSSSGKDQPYFLIRNSWGTDWGEDGYFRLATEQDGSDGICGVLLDANWPVTN